MWKILTYSLLLIAGIIVSQLFNLEHFHVRFIDFPIPLTDLVIPFSHISIPLHVITMTCLAYIMMEVGLEFVIDKKNLRPYVYDYLVAVTAATFPWIFCALYFYFVLGSDIQESLLVGRFAAPTSAGVLFAMLSAAGLAATWFFKKARILAIFDDLDTILLMIPLQVMFVGFKLEAFLLIAIILFILYISYRYLHQLKLPTKDGWLLIYGIIIVYLCYIFEHTTEIPLEVLLPAFAFGAMLYNPHEPHYPKTHPHQFDYLEPVDTSSRFIDIIVKNLFMFLVGCSLPKIDFDSFFILPTIGNVLALTLLSNLGKMYPAFCYKKEATLRERLALSVAMFPRGEVGAGVLLVAISYNLHVNAIKIAALSLALNLLLTGVFIAIAIWLIKPVYQKSK